VTKVPDSASGETVADGIPPFDPGTNVLVVDERGGDALPFSLSRPGAEGGVVVVTTDLPAASIADIAPRYLAEGARLDVVDCTGESAAVDAPGVASLVSAGQDLPSVGEAAVEAIQAAETTPLTTVHLGSVSRLVAQSTVQQVYKLLYVVAARVRANDLVAFYVWDGPSEAKTLRILGQALDRRISLDGRGEPTVRSSTEWSVEDG
jgi:hypothetical protein